MAESPAPSSVQPRVERAAGPPSNTQAGARLTTLKRRPQFLRVRTGARWATPTFVLEGRRRDTPALPGDAPAPPEAPRFGFTVSKQVGSAVERNRIRRRLKAAVRGILPDHARRNFDYVLIARRPALDVAFAVLVSDLVEALQRVHTRKPRARQGTGGERH
jgi:ribonuclease P protein component